MTTKLGPPWVLFVDNGKPVAILPAMRQGEVANVSKLTMAQAQAIVNAANQGSTQVDALESLERAAASIHGAVRDGAELAALRAVADAAERHTHRAEQPYSEQGTTYLKLEAAVKAWRSGHRKEPM